MVTRYASRFSTTSRVKPLTADHSGRAIGDLGTVMLVALPLLFATGGADAAASAGCEGGGFTVLGRTQNATIPASALGTSFRVQGKYAQFDVDSATLGIRNFTLTGAPNPLDITGGVPTPVFASKLPDHRGLSLTSSLTVEIKETEIEIGRTGRDLSMKIQAKDCATGGIFQMEVEREDGTPTLFTHILAEGANPSLKAFYFDNRNFRNREGDEVPFKDITVIVPARVNFGNDFSRKFVGRDSPQVATRRAEPGCVNQITTRFPGAPATVRHCGGVSRWDVASGGRMGQVMGEDAVEVAPPATECVQNCQAQNRVRGRSTVLGFPFPVDLADRLQPRSPPQPAFGAAQTVATNPQ
ncbi:hypothetical protein FG93_03450 [Bosea sp. LC85]|uniref:hypothetical protein n=1 Tax=Bosea sp. LC85 TaxID=1502851 RepID=UPI0004E4509B|nr:hypothetical protein [Bosea sp. LC85]KFC69404.1 hypothetical protein FG93_03450 [Bosea sp. LC85]